MIQLPEEVHLNLKMNINEYQILTINSTAALYLYP